MYYAVTGRIPFYENETAVFWANSRGQAVEFFTAWMYQQIFAEEAAAKRVEIETAEGQAVYVDVVVKSETEITLA